MHPYRYNIGYGDNMMDGSHGWLGFIVAILFIAAIVAIAFYLIRTLSTRNQINSGVRDPLDIARERFAKGEISKEELAEIKKELR